MDTPPGDGQLDDALIPAVELTDELVTEWRSSADARHLGAHSDQPLIYRVGRPPYTEAAGLTAMRHAMGLIERAAERIGDGEQALRDAAFRIGLGTGAYAARKAMGYPLPTFPPPRETPSQWRARLESDLADWLFTRLAVDPPPGDVIQARASADRWQRLARQLHSLASARTLGSRWATARATRGRGPAVV